jgi:predicted porin
MKKSLIALAVLAASGASFAQSSVSVYGVADLWFGSLKAGNVRNNVIESGGVAASRFGFKGSEDLGGGLKANFLLEQGFNIDSGSTTAGQAFSRQSYVGLSGNFGEVKLGKMWTAYDDVAGGTQAVFDSALSPLSAPLGTFVWRSQTYAANPANGLYYVSPSFGGVTAAVSYALGENKNANVAATSTTAFNVQYAGGPVTAAFAYQKQKDTNAVAASAIGVVPVVVAVAGTASVEDTNFTTLRGSYNFGVAKLIAAYGRTTNGDNKANDYMVGVDVPVAQALTLSAAYARSKDNDNGGSIGDKRTGYGIAAAYSLSKRTTAYAGLRFSKTDENGQSVEANDVKIYALGLNHTF